MAACGHERRFRKEEMFHINYKVLDREAASASRYGSWKVSPFPGKAGHWRRTGSARDRKPYLEARGVFVP
jgi:hypothetical protein